MAEENAGASQKTSRRTRKTSAELCFDLPSPFGAVVTELLSPAQLKELTIEDCRHIMTACSAAAQEIAKIVAGAGDRAKAAGATDDE